MAAYTDTTATDKFAHLLYEIADIADRDIQIDDAAAAGWLVPIGETLRVTDHDSGDEYLVTVQRVSHNY